MALTQNHWESLGKSPVSKHTLVDNPALKFPSYDFEGRSEKQRGSSGTSPRRDVVTVVLLATVVLTVAASTAGLWIKQLKMEERMQELASRSGCVVPHPGQVDTSFGRRGLSPNVPDRSHDPTVSRHRRSIVHPGDPGPSEIPNATTAPPTLRLKFAHLIPIRTGISYLDRARSINWRSSVGHNELFQLSDGNTRLKVLEDGAFHVYLSFAINGRRNNYLGLDGACRLKVTRTTPAGHHTTLMYPARTQDDGGRMVYRASDGVRIYPFDTVYQAGIFQLAKDDVIQVKTIQLDRNCRYVYHDDKTYFGALLLG